MAETRTDTNDSRGTTKNGLVSLNSLNQNKKNPTSNLRSLNSASRISVKNRDSVTPVGDKNKKLTLADFDLLNVLGRGAFGKVYLATKKGEKKYFAIKSLKKRLFNQTNQSHLVKNEKSILQNAIHPFVVRLHYSFQDESALFFVMDFLPGGELLSHLSKVGVFDEETTRFYAAEVILGLQYLHEKLNIIYRDLKPENLLLDTDGHIKITDFGLSTTAKESKSICGTLFYIAPEILLAHEEIETADQQGKPSLSYDKRVDWWSLGCLIFQMLAGILPFDSKDHDKLQRDIVEQEPYIPPNFSESAKDLIKKLLVKDPKKRLGNNGADEIKKHKFFERINWDDIANKTRKGPIKLNVTKAGDVKNFSQKFLDEKPAETPRADPFDDMDKSTFEGFSYARKELGGDFNMHMPNMLLNKV